MSTPRGIRNNNPGNIEHHARNKWQGLADPPSDGRFCKFLAPVWGIRAIAITLISYYDRHKASDGSKIDTIQEVIERWAPAIENEVKPYVDHVDELHPKTAFDILDFHSYEDMEPLVRGIIAHENGRKYADHYDQATLDEALRLAGVRAPLKPLTKSKEMTAAGGTAVVGVVQEIVAAPELVAQVEKGQESLEAGTVIKVAIGLVLIGLAVFIAWNRIKARQEGVR